MSELLLATRYCNPMIKRLLIMINNDRPTGPWPVGPLKIVQKGPLFAEKGPLLQNIFEFFRASKRCQMKWALRNEVRLKMARNWFLLSIQWSPVTVIIGPPSSTMTGDKFWSSPPLNNDIVRFLWNCSAPLRPHQSAKKSHQERAKRALLLSGLQGYLRLVYTLVSLRKERKAKFDNGGKKIGEVFREKVKKMPNE